MSVLKKLFFVFIALPLLLFSQKKTYKVACIGDETTKGIMFHKHQITFTDELQQFLGNQFHVKNFGAEKKTVMNIGGMSYGRDNIANDVIDFNPDYTFVQLGRVDGKLFLKRELPATQFENDYISLINGIKQTCINTKIILVTVPPIYDFDTHTYVQSINGINDIIKKIANNQKLEILDYNKAFKLKWLLKDGKTVSPEALSFLAKQSSMKLYKKEVNFSLIAKASSEENKKNRFKWGYSDWNGQVENINELILKHKDSCKIAFLGDNSVQGWTYPIDRMARTKNRKIFDRNFAKYNAINMGISGDRIENVLYRVPIHFKNLSPEYIILSVGQNNLLSGESAESVAEGIENLIKTIQKQTPTSKIILHGPIFAGLENDSDLRKRFEHTHLLISILDDYKNVYYMPLYKKFILPNGKIDFRYISKDHISVKLRAYDYWAKEIVKFIAPKTTVVVSN